MQTPVALKAINLRNSHLHFRHNHCAAAVHRTYEVQITRISRLTKAVPPFPKQETEHRSSFLALAFPFLVSFLVITTCPSAVLLFRFFSQSWFTTRVMGCPSLHSHTVVILGLPDNSAGYMEQHPKCRFFLHFISKSFLPPTDTSVFFSPSEPCLLYGVSIPYSDSNT